jgi:hypothetical protein
MNQDNSSVQILGSNAQPDEAAVCDGCGRSGAYRIGDRALCLECYVGYGSCCPEFGKDDLWEFPDEDSPMSTERSETHAQPRNVPAGVQRESEKQHG